MNRAADLVYGKGYGYDNQIEYEEGLNYSGIKKFKKYLVAGTSQDWIDEAMDEREGSEDLLPEPLVTEHDILKKQGLAIKANDLLVPIGRWRLPYLFKAGRIDTSPDPWILSDCDYSREIGLEI